MCESMCVCGVCVCVGVYVCRCMCVCRCVCVCVGVCVGVGVCVCVQKFMHACMHSCAYAHYIYILIFCTYFLHFINPLWETWAALPG